MNIENHKKVIKQIESDPECWDQTTWHCGAKHCYAGWAQILSGKPENTAMACRDAREFLDLSHSEADYLFAPERTLVQLKEFPNDSSYTCEVLYKLGQEQPWIQGTPTIEQVMQHKKDHGGWWIQYAPDKDLLRFRRLREDKLTEVVDAYTHCSISQEARYFPVGPDGLPICNTREEHKMSKYTILGKPDIRQIISDATAEVNFIHLSGGADWQVVLFRSSKEVDVNEYHALLTQIPGAGKVGSNVYMGRALDGLSFITHDHEGERLPDGWLAASFYVPTNADFVGQMMASIKALHVVPRITVVAYQ
jgi:hypothetical protein